MRRLLILGLLVAGLLLLVAAPAFAQDGSETAAEGFGAIAVQLAAASLVVEKIIQSLKNHFGFLNGTAISVVAVGLGFAAAYGFELTVGASGSEFIDKLFAALSVFGGSSLIFETTDK